MRAIVGVDVSDVAPVSTERTVVSREIVRKHVVCANQIRKDILSELVTSIEISGVAEQCLAQRRLH